jgi:hypothetical protein
MTGTKTSSLPAELCSIDLPKWLGCEVDGPTVTMEQADEILVRTGSSCFSTNDHEFKSELERIFYTAHPLAESWPNQWWEIDFSKETTIEERRESYQRTLQYREAMGILPLSYLTTERAVSSWIGGPHGWCDWEGRIYQRGVNIGKWPNVENVADDWKQIAEAFPWLSLESRLLAHEAGFPDGDKPRVAIVFEVANGSVAARLPEQADHDKCDATPGEANCMDFAARLMSGISGERGVSLSRWRSACERVAAIMLAKQD